MNKIKNKLEFNRREACEKIQNFIKQNVYKLYKKGVVIGISGGIDSAISATLAVRTLGSKNVFALLLFEKESNPKSIIYARKLCNKLKIKYKEIDITQILNQCGVYKKKEQLLKKLFSDFDPKIHKTSLILPKRFLERNKINFPKINFIKNNKIVHSQRLDAKNYCKIIGIQNVKQRIRMVLLYMDAEIKNYLVCGTTNKTELMLGQFVKYGDGGVDIEPLADLFKTQIYELAEYLKIPQEIIKRPPSPDTWNHYTSDEEFYWRMPLKILDQLLCAKELKLSVKATAEEIGLTQKQINKGFIHFDNMARKARTLLEKNTYNKNFLGLKMKEIKWYKQDIKPAPVLSFFKSIFRDFLFKNRRYEYVETFFRNIPGYFGVYLRNKFLTKYFKSAGKNIVIWPGIKIRRAYKMEVGNNVHIDYDNHYQASAGIKIGDNTLLGPGIKIWTKNHIFRDINKTISHQGYECCPVEIGSDCWIASNVFIKPGVVIPDGCIVAANSVVGVIKIPPYSVLAGNPAKVLGGREKLGAFVKFKEKI